MIIFLIGLYILQANGVIVPTGRMIAAWAYLALYPVIAIINKLLD